MEISMISDARQQEMNLEFDFQTKANKILIQVTSNDNHYQSEIKSDQEINFNLIKESLTNRDFTILSTKNNTLKLLVCDITLLFPGIDQQKIISDLRKRLMELQISTTGLIGIQVRKISEISNLTMEIWKDSELLKKVTKYQEEYQRKLEQLEVGKKWHIEEDKPQGIKS